ncbi:YoaK family protein [Nostoc sp. NIES-2111]
MHGIRKPMQSYKRAHRSLAVAIAALAGFIDALGFIQLGGLFVSFMSGNSTRFAVGMQHAPLAPISLLPAVMILLFVLGVMGGRVLRHYATRRPSTSILAAMTALLALAGLLFEQDLPVRAVMLMAVAMGAANNIFFRQGEVSIGVTYVTGTLVKLGQRLAGLLLKEKGTEWLHYLLLWLGLVVGAGMGAIGYATFGFGVLWGGVGFCLLLTLACLRIETED